MSPFTSDNTPSRKVLIVPLGKLRRREVKQLPRATRLVCGRGSFELSSLVSAPSVPPLWKTDDLQRKKCPPITGRGRGGVSLCHHVRWVDWVPMAWCQDSPVPGYVCGSGLRGLHPFLLSFRNKLWKPGAVAEPCTHSALSWLCPGRGCLWPAELMGSWLGPWGQAAFLPGGPVFLFQLQACGDGTRWDSKGSPFLPGEI